MMYSNTKTNIAVENITHIFGKKFSPRKIDNSQNPWPGLSPYTDPQDTNESKLFCGRDDEIFDLCQLIQGNIFVTLYGKSGNGKTSLLNAGVCPKLREVRFVPVSIRLGILEQDISFQEFIISEITEMGLNVREINVLDKSEDVSSVDYLWNYFARHKFYNKEGKVVFPVVILDQFEEVFRDRQEETVTLLKQIHFMMDEGHALSNRYVNEELYEYSFNFRFVVSIREDDLFKLEDVVDSYYLTSMKKTRYRLRPLTKAGAQDVILKPGKGHFKEDEEGQIVETILGIATGADSNISSNILSLLCSRIYIGTLIDHYVGPITHEYVEKIVSRNPLEQFYLEATEKLSSKEKAYLEDNLVDVSGRRGSIPVANFKNAIKNGDVLLQGATKILQESNGRIELIHDSFCPVLVVQKSQRKERWLSYIDHVALFLTTVLMIVFAKYIPTWNRLQNELTSIVGADFKWNYFGGMQIWIVVYIPMTIGLIRRSYKTSLPVLALLISSFPFAAYTVMYCYAIYGCNQSVEYSLSLHFLICEFLLIFCAGASLLYAKMKQTDEQDRMSFSELLYGLRQTRIWLTVYAFACLYISLYDGYYYITGMSFIWVLLISLFSSLSKDEVFNENWVLVLLCMMPIAFIVFNTSDVELFAFSKDNIIPYLFVVGLILYLCFTIWKEDGIGSFMIMLFICLLYLGIPFLYYVFFYKYKFWMLFGWTSILFVVFYFLLYANNSRHPIRTCLINFLFIIGTYSFFLGYNPLITGIDESLQTDRWRWKTILKKTGEKIEILDAWTGNKLVAAEFDDIDTDGYLILETCYQFKGNFGNYFMEPIESTSNIRYNYYPDLEYEIYRGNSSGMLWAKTYSSYRDLILSDLKNDSRKVSEESLKNISQLAEAEKSATLKVLRQNTAFTDITSALCKVISTNLLCNVSYDRHEDEAVEMARMLIAFDKYAYAHTFDIVEKSTDTDWDSQFESIVQSYLLIANENTADEFVPSALSLLISRYEEATNYRQRLFLYDKIFRLNQIALKCQMKDYMTTIKSPYD